MRPISGEPVTTGTARVAPQTRAAVIRPDPSATSAARTIHGIHAADGPGRGVDPVDGPGRGRCARVGARTIHGIHAAAARWFQRSTSERNGPDATHPAAATAAPGRESPRRRPSAYTPRALKRKCATTKHV